jgi:hypothetical protein
MRLAVLLVAVCACGACDGVEDPASSGDPLMALTPASPDRADDAVALAVASYEREIGVTMPPVVVHWVVERIPLRGATVIGLHRACDDIWVTWWEGPALSRLAMVHEVGHCARVAAGLPSDPEHEDAAWWAKDETGVVERVRRQLAGAGF